MTFDELDAYAARKAKLRQRLNIAKEILYAQQGARDDWELAQFNLRRATDPTDRAPPWQRLSGAAYWQDQSARQAKRAMDMLLTLLAEPIEGE